MTHRSVEPSPIDLTALTNDADDHVFDPQRERALLDAFDAAWTTPSVAARPRGWQPLAAAAVVLLAAGATWMFANRRADLRAPHAASSSVAAIAPRVEPAAQPLAPAVRSQALSRPAARHHAATATNTPAVLSGASAFVPWPGADTLPAFESGRLMRLDLPEPLAISLGLSLRPSPTGVVRADILVGQDGLARAVRVAP